MEKEKALQLAGYMRDLADIVERDWEYIDDYNFVMKHDPISEVVDGIETYRQGSKSWHIKIWEYDKYKCERIFRSKEGESVG